LDRNKNFKEKMAKIYWLAIQVGEVVVVLMVIQLLGQTIEIQKFKVGSNIMLISIRFFLNPKNGFTGK